MRKEQRSENSNTVKGRREALGGAIGGLALFGAASLFAAARQTPLLLILAFVAGVIAGSGTAGEWWSRTG